MNYNFEGWWKSNGSFRAASITSKLDELNSIKELCRDSFNQAHKTLPTPTQVYKEFMKTFNENDPEHVKRREILGEDMMEFEGFYQ